MKDLEAQEKLLLYIPNRARALWMRETIRNVYPANALSNPPSKSHVLLQYCFVILALQHAYKEQLRGQNLEEICLSFPKLGKIPIALNTSGRGKVIWILSSFHHHLLDFAICCPAFAAGQGSPSVHEKPKRKVLVCRCWATSTHRLSSSSLSLCIWNWRTILISLEKAFRINGWY